MVNCLHFNSVETEMIQNKEENEYLEARATRGNSGGKE